MAQEWTPERSAAGHRSIWLIASVVSLATFMEVLDSSIANVSLDHIAGSLSASYDEATWVLTSYLMANAIAIPIAGWLSNIVGRKRFYMICVALFTVSSLMCGLSQSLPFLLFSRIVQGLGGGGLAPSEQAILAQTFPPQKRGMAFALYGLTIITAPIIGPTFGGFLTDLASWHWVFLINVPFGLLSLFLVHVFVVDPPKLEQERRARLAGGIKVDAPGILLLILWLGAQEFVLDRGQRLDWLESPLILGCTLIAAAAAVLLFTWEWNHPKPVFDVHLLLKPSFAVSLAAMLITGAVIYGTSSILPQFLQQVLGYTASTAGEAMTLGGLVTIVMLPIAGRLIAKVEPKYLAMAGLASEAVALFVFTRMNGEVSWWWAALARTGLAVGVPFLFIPINTAAYADIPGPKAPEASAQLSLMRNVGGSVSIAAAQALLAQRAQFHQARIVETVTRADPNYRAWTRGVIGGLQHLGAGAGRGALGQIYAAVVRQASVLAYIDVFYTLGVAVTVVVPFLLLMKKVHRRA